MIASFWFSRCSRRWRATAAFWLGIGCDDTQAWSVEVRRIMTGLIWLAVGVGDVAMVAWKGRVGALLHALSPWLATKIRRLRLSRSRQSTRSWWSLLDWPIEVDADAISSLAGVLISKCEHKRRSIANRCSCSSSTRSAHAAFRLTEVNHVDGKWKVLVVRWRISSQELRNL